MEGVEGGGEGGVAPGPGEGRGFSLLPVHTAQLSQQDLELIGTRLEIQVRAAGRVIPARTISGQLSGGWRRRWGRCRAGGSG